MRTPLFTRVYAWLRNVRNVKRENIVGETFGYVKIKCYLCARITTILLLQQQF